MKDDNFVLGIHPTARGFGWALFEGAASPFDWGTVTVNARERRKLLKRFGNILERYQPSVLALEKFDGEASHRGRKTERIAGAMAALAKHKQIRVAVYTRAHIQTALSGAAGRTRHEIAVFVANNVDALRDRLPPKRKIWESEHTNLALFNAAACALTWFATAT